MTRLLYAFALGWVLHLTYLMGASDGAREAEAERSALVDMAADQLAEADADRAALVAEFNREHTA